MEEALNATGPKHRATALARRSLRHAAWMRPGERMPTTVARVSSDFAERLNRLFDAVRGPDGRPYTNDAVIAAIQVAGGATISRGYLSELRSGKKDNPTLRAIVALAAFFGVDPAYFVADSAAAESGAAELELVRAMRDAEVRNLAMRASRLSPAELDVITTMIDKVGQLKLPGQATQEDRSSAGSRVAAPED